MRDRANHLIVGADGSGRTAALQRLVRTLSGSLIDLSPRPGDRQLPLSVLLRAHDQPGHTPTREELADYVGSFATIVIDDAHELDDDSAAVLTDLANGDHVFVVARRPRLNGRALATFDEAISRFAKTTTLTPMTTDDARQTFGVDEPEHLVSHTAGRAGLIALILADPSLAAIDSRVQRRLATLSAPAGELVRVLSAVHPARLGDELLTTLTHTDTATLEASFAELTDLGFVDSATSLIIPLLAERTLAQLDAAGRRALHRRLASDLASVNDVDPVVVATQWRDSGSIRPETGAAFHAAGRATATARPDAALEWFGLALEAGSAPADLWFDHGAAALALGTDLAPEPDDLDRRRADVFHARRSAQLGQWSRALALLDGAGDAGNALLVTGALINGHLGRAAELVRERPPLTTAPSAAFDAACVSTVVDGGVTLELADEASALRRSGHADELLDTPEALASLALSIATADDAWRQACEPVPELRPAVELVRALDRRMVLLDAFLRVRRGDFATGKAVCSAFADTTVRGRDAALLFAITSALARRAVRPELQRAAFQRADEVRRWVAADPFSTEVAEELLVAAARIGDTVWVSSGLDQLRHLASQLGEQSPWRAQIGWAMAQVAITTHDAELLNEADRIVTELPWLPGTKPLAFGLAIRCWTDVLQRDKVDPGSAQRAADALESIGLCFEAAQLLGQAALDIPLSDPKVGELLGRAQDIVRRPPNVESPTTADDETREPSLLSAREEEVAELKFLGHKNQVIAERLFIGVKTVETYVTRINTKFNAANRAEFVESYGKYRTRQRSPIA